MKTLTCIVCPTGCTLTVGEGDDPRVSGNRCPRGAVYAREEIRSPRRVVTATCPVEGGPGPRRAPVKSSCPCPRERIPALLADIYRTRITPPAKAGDTLIAGWQGTGIDVVLTGSV
jgi:CxxC motif-containing protein